MADAAAEHKREMERKKFEQKTKTEHEKFALEKQKTVADIELTRSDAKAARYDKYGRYYVPIVLIAILAFIDINANFWGGIDATTWAGLIRSVGSSSRG